MKILGKDDVIEVGDVLMFGYTDKEPEKIEHVMIAAGFAGDVVGSDDKLIFAFRMSEHEQMPLQKKLAKSADGEYD